MTEKGFVQEEAVCTALLERVREGLTNDGLQSQACTAWLLVLVYSGDKFLDMICNFLDAHIKFIKTLMNAKDEVGRIAVDVATPMYKAAMLERTYFMKRFEIKEGPPEHMSATCVVVLAVDHQDNKAPVALKFIRDRTHFEREMGVRNSGGFDNKYVISCLTSYDGAVDCLLKGGHM